MPPGDRPTVQAYLDRYVCGEAAIAAASRGGCRVVADGDAVLRRVERQRIWTFWRRVLHTCHHRTQVQTWLRLAGQQVPPIYGPSGDVRWDEADPTYSVAAAGRGG